MPLGWVLGVMSEFEFIEAYHLALDLVVNAAMNSVVVTFAYIVASYMAGEKLSKVAALGMTAIYSLFLLGPLGGMFGGCTRIIKTVERYFEIYPEGWAFQQMPGIDLYFVTLIPVLLAWLASLMYLHLYVRGKGN